MRSRLALVPGEPGGVGPELCVRLAQSDRQADLVCLADPDTLNAAAHRLNLPLKLIDADSTSARAGELALLEVKNAVPSEFGVANPANAAAVIGALRLGGQYCLEGRYAGLVTGPVNKAAINAAGITYTGTTELLAEQAGVEVVMMLANDKMRVALLTTHVPLKSVANLISPELLSKKLRIIHQALRHQFKISAPRIAVLGLNPHAGEDGVLGDEEKLIIEPVIKHLHAEGMLVIGPLPADTAFLPAKLQNFDAVLAMYHDQGLPVLKYSGFEQGVNISLGLPYPRVAVDHGTALDIAGSGQGDAQSLICAVDLCRQLALKQISTHDVI